MKGSKWVVLFMMFVVMGLAQQASAQPVDAGIGISIRGEFQGTDTLAGVAHAGDNIDYIVRVIVNAEQFPIFNGEPNLILPDGTVIDLDDNLELATDTSMTYDVAGTYVIDTNDLGSLTGADGDEVRAVATVRADSNVPGNVQSVTATTNWDILVVNPCIDVDKTAEPTLSKEGDEVLYTIVITNCGDTILDVNDINDTLLGSLTDTNPACDALDVGEDCTIADIPYTIQPGDPDPLENIVTVIYEDRVGIPFRQVTDTDNALVDLVDPNFEVIKECPPYSKPGDTIGNTITITNTSNDANLVILSVIDSIKGELDDCDGLLAKGQQCVINYDYVVQVSDPNELINDVNVVAQVQGLPNIINETAMCQTDLVHPDYTVLKECLTQPVTGDTAQFRITLTNTGDIDLIITSDEAELAGPLDLVVGQQIVVDVNRPVPAEANEVSNTINVLATLPPEVNLPNEIIKSSSSTCDVEIPGLEGCTPGFWKNHPDCWDCYSPDTLLGDVFDLPWFNTRNKTLMEALNFRGGRTVKAKARILLRAAVAALLNACDPDVDYPLTVAGIISDVNAAIATQDKGVILGLKDELDAYNNLGCPINAHCIHTGIED
jgi:hypothetical protein